MEIIFHMSRTVSNNMAKQIKKGGQDVGKVPSMHVDIILGAQHNNGIFASSLSLTLPLHLSARSKNKLELVAVKSQKQRSNISAGALGKK